MTIPADGEWNDSLAGDFLWTRANYGEAVPDVMTPCTWSFVQILLDNADPSVGPYHYGNIGGRLYANLSEAASLAAAFGFSPKRFARLIETGFGKLPEGVEIPIVRLSPWRLLINRCLCSSTTHPAWPQPEANAGLPGCGAGAVRSTSKPASRPSPTPVS